MVKRLEKSKIIKIIVLYIIVMIMMFMQLPYTVFATTITFTNGVTKSYETLGWTTKEYSYTEALNLLQDYYKYSESEAKSLLSATEKLDWMEGLSDEIKELVGYPDNYPDELEDRTFLIDSPDLTGHFYLSDSMANNLGLAQLYKHEVLAFGAWDVGIEIANKSLLGTITNNNRSGSQW